MNRKQFIEGHGATCSNWNWSWSFINEKERFVIFGLWKDYDDGQNPGLILSYDWQYSASGRKKNGFDQSIRHLKLVSDGGYQLYTFPMKAAVVNAEGEETSPVRIDSFEPVLVKKALVRVGGNFYAGVFQEAGAPETSFQQTVFIEGRKVETQSSVYERNPAARAACLAEHGFKCVCCGFDFEAVFGNLGKGFIEVHHKNPIAKATEERVVDPKLDLVPLCPNCHSMIHRTNPMQTVEDLREHMEFVAKNFPS